MRDLSVIGNKVYWATVSFSKARQSQGQFTLYNFFLQLSHAIVTYDCRKVFK